MHDVDSRKLKNAISGVLVVDKPVGMTSHDVVAIIRKGTGLRRIGHTGTLDPRASGVLVVVIGPAVRLSEYLLTARKRYEAGIHLGAISDTYDEEGNIIVTAEDVVIDEEAILEKMKIFTGQIEQVPPAYSAIKIGGKKACDMARKGESVELKPRHVEVFSFDLVEFSPPELTVDIFCSSGTYVRSIANDLGRELGCGAYLSSLRRTVSGNFSLRDAITLPDLQKSFQDGNWYQYLIPASDTLEDFETLMLDTEDEVEIRHGRRIVAHDAKALMAKAISVQGELIAILEYCPDTNEWKPKKVLYP